MKINKCTFIIIVLLSVMITSSCSNKYGSPKQAANKIQEIQNIASSDVTDYYKIDIDKAGNYYLNLYDQNKNIVYYEKFANKPPSVSKLGSRIVQISLSVGSPATYVTFFDTKSKTKSATFFNPILIDKGRIIYFGDKFDILIVSDIFDKRKYYKEIKRPFSPVAAASNAVLKARFLEDNKLYLDYLVGDSFTEKAEIIDLTL